MILIIITDGTRVSYFRGRKLHGKAMKLPDGYRGVVVEKQAPTPAAEEEVINVDQDEAEEHVPLGSLEAKAEFDELVVWGHESVADAASDPYVRIEEWTALAEQVSILFKMIVKTGCTDQTQIHSYPAVEKSS